MKIHIFCTYDKAAELYNPPFHAPSIGLAIRSFADEANRVAENNMINRHPKDFTLWHLGEFDQATGRHFLLGEPRQIAFAPDLISGDQGAMAEGRPRTETDLQRAMYNARNGIGS